VAYEIVEMNPDTVRAVRAEGERSDTAMHHRELLKSVAIEQAASW